MVKLKCGSVFWFANSSNAVVLRLSMIWRHKWRHLLITSTTLWLNLSSGNSNPAVGLTILLWNKQHEVYFLSGAELLPRCTSCTINLTAFEPICFTLLAINSLILSGSSLYFFFFSPSTLGSIIFSPPAFISFFDFPFLSFVNFSLPFFAPFVTFCVFSSIAT